METAIIIVRFIWISTFFVRSSSFVYVVDANRSVFVPLNIEILVASLENGSALCNSQGIPPWSFGHFPRKRGQADRRAHLGSSRQSPVAVVRCT